MTERYNPRWIAYLRYSGMQNPKNHEYINWISNKWREWERLNDLQPHCGKTPEMHRQFDIWLEEGQSERGG